MPGTLDLALLDEVQHDLVVRHQHEAGLVHDRRVVQLLVGVPCREERDGGLVDGRPAHPGVQIPGCEGRGRDAAEPGAMLRSMQERNGPPVVLRRQPPREVQRRTGDMAVDVDPAREDQQAACIDRAAAFDLGNDPALGDADVLDDAIEPVGRIMDLPAGDAQHTVREILSPAHRPGFSTKTACAGERRRATFQGRRNALASLKGSPYA